ncbi:cytochrome b5 domain-containing protein 1 isoform X2 [Calonectris borealis]|uniref:cytochrome b5 domain-containing protein 1 isoform X2 n=1 Tax=Calonectris borealis TaxID=1323832 RepID=UPI003F4AFD5D
MATGGAAERPRLLLRREVAARARQRWVSARGRGLALGPFLRDRPGDPQLRPLLEAAGSDVSHWFDPQTGDPLTRVDPQSGLRRWCLPGGAPPEPRSDWAPPRSPPWWADPRLEVGRLTAEPRPLRLRNTLTGQEHVIEGDTASMSPSVILAFHHMPSLGDGDTVPPHQVTHMSPSVPPPG